MSIKVKICGISTVAALDAARDAGADFVGLVFFPRSPRNVTISQAAEIAGQALGLHTVALTVDADNDALAEISLALRPDFIQLHGSESPARVSEIKELTGVKIIKAIKVGVANDVLKSKDFEPVADIILFDAEVRAGPSTLPGGNGEAFDWTWLRSKGLRPNFMLSGGLNPDNVQRAIELSGARAVDVSSGVEDAPGFKSNALISRFVIEAKALQTLGVEH